MVILGGWVFLMREVALYLADVGEVARDGLDVSLEAEREQQVRLVQHNNLSFGPDVRLYGLCCEWGICVWYLRGICKWNCKVLYGICVWYCKVLLGICLWDNLEGFAEAHGSSGEVLRQPRGRRDHHARERGEHRLLRPHRLQRCLAFRVRGLG